MKSKSLILSALTAVPMLAMAQAQRLNIIYIMCDDMGYGDLGCYGQQLIQTPNLDKMAATGMRFTQAYAGSPVSAPSRASFMTGQHSGHGHVRGNREYWRGTDKANAFGQNTDFTCIGQEPYDMDHVIIPEIFHQNGYCTGMFGKWAGGYYNLEHPNEYAADEHGNTDTSKSATTSSLSLPNKRGIDCYYGPICQFQAHTYYPNYLNRYDPERYGDTCVVVDTLQQNIQHASVASGNPDYENREQYSSDLIHQYALDWIGRQSKDAPFLGIFTYTLPHAELWQPRDSILNHYNEAFAGEDSPFRGNYGSWYYANTNRHAQFAAMITRLDAQVGEIFAKLEEKGLADNTLVIFTSDNGPHEEGGADPDWFNRDGLLKGKKRSTYEGGIRVPFIAKGPGVPKGTTNPHQFAFYDLMATFCEYAGIDNYKQYNPKGEDDYFDGISFAPTLTGRNGQQQEHEYLYWEFHETDMMGLRWGDWKLVVQGGNCRLYDLATDIHEDNDLADKYPEVLAKMKGFIKKEHVDSPLFRVTLPE